MTTISSGTRSLLMLLLFVAAPLQAAAQPAAAEGPGLEVVRDLAYRPDGATAYERERCKLDLYLPKARQGFATIVWCHGGSLRGGNKVGDIAVSFAQRFAKAGIAVAAVNYRLSPRVQSPAYVEDAAAAVAFVHSQIGRYGGADERDYGTRLGPCFDASVARPKQIREMRKSPRSMQPPRRKQSSIRLVKGERKTIGTWQSGLPQTQKWPASGARTGICPSVISVALNQCRKCIGYDLSRIAFASYPNRPRPIVPLICH